MLTGVAKRIVGLLGFVSIAACSSIETVNHGPVAEGVSGPLGTAVPFASAEQLASFERGREVALRRFTLAEGLGPAFNVTFCGSCHERPVFGGSAGLYRNFFIGGRGFPDGSFVPTTSADNDSGVIRIYAYGNDFPARPDIATDINIMAQRNPIPFFGVGLLAELSEDEILSRADPDDRDGDGISGRANFDRGFVGRFGLKAQTVSIEGFIRGPLFNHMGITSDPLTEEQRRQLPVDSSLTELRSMLPWAAALGEYAQGAAMSVPLEDDDAAPDPELSPGDLFDLVSFAMLMAAPEYELTEQGEKGMVAFSEARCDSCHTPRLQGPRGPLAVYSDLLLHDMGDDLADGIRAEQATGREFRTQPLWGIATVGPYLHDGRATTLEEAILAHGGEAETSRNLYANLAMERKADLNEFLMCLGGRSQATLGLIPPGDPTPAEGTYGGPLPGLSPEQLQTFEAGRILFDREFGLSDGVGAPMFNGDSCRACHFEPTLGGAGPRGVNVTRHGTLSPEGDYSDPVGGSIMHRVTSIPGQGIFPDSGVNVFEHRQTPHVFGLGLIEGISEATILANEDPDDIVTPDGISGRASYTEGGQLGRFGWKAQVPSLAEFVRDAGFAELGMTLAESSSLTFGATSDSDEVQDPELPMSNEQLLTEFLQLIGPPPRQPSQNPTLVDAGGSVFDSVGCSDCHVPSLPGTSGPVPLYSDLLLHEILPVGAAGIEEAGANIREFRTAPLWGLATTAPYLHSGAADTVAQAIEAHDGEATASRDAYRALPEADRDALLEFLGTL